MREFRSSSQILFGYLPQQTVDLQGGVWRVTHWRSPLQPPHVDIPSLRQQIVQQAAPWRAAGRDGGFVSHIEGTHRLRVYTLDRNNGVEVEPFPRVWMCKACHRILRDRDTPCPCGSRSWPGQLPFVGYHAECGAIREPYIRPCPDHGEVRIEFPGTASASEIRFTCPTCARVLGRGFGQPQCDCGQGQIVFNVHRASSVYTPQSVVIVNPPSTDRIAAITNAGGRSRALSWLAGGMSTRTVEEAGMTSSGLRRQLLESGLSQEAVERMMAAAEDTTGGSADTESIDLPQGRLEEAERDAMTIALAMSQSRFRVSDLADATSPESELGRLYRNDYPAALAQAGLVGIDFVDDFPVLTGSYGYTRGDPSPGASRLVPFRNRQNDYVVYGDITETEALYVQLDPLSVSAWLEARGFQLCTPGTYRDARIAILAHADLPTATDGEARGEFGDTLLRLVHSYSHRFIRICALHAGIDRNALSELVVPRHLGFFVYAAARGDFVLGGLQAVFESALHTLLSAILHEEHRCPLDPGCAAEGGACMACLHVGEPSCRYFNRFLDRSTLAGPEGYFRVTGR